MSKTYIFIANTVIGNTVAIASSIRILYAVLFYTEKYNNFINLDSEVNKTQNFGLDFSY